MCSMSIRVEQKKSLSHIHFYLDGCRERVVLTLRVMSRKCSIEHNKGNREEEVEG